MSPALRARHTLLDRAAGRLRHQPPGFLEPRCDLKGDHALNPETWGALPTGRPRNAAVLVPIVEHESGPCVLLTERASGLRNHSGQIAFPGGRMDPEDRTAIDTALREAEEEIGLPRDFVQPLGYLDAYLSSSNYFVLPVVALVSPGAPCESQLWPWTCTCQRCRRRSASRRCVPTCSAGVCPWICGRRCRWT